MNVATAATTHKGDLVHFASLVLPTSNVLAIDEFYGSVLGLTVVAVPAARASPDGAALGAPRLAVQLAAQRIVQIGSTSVSFVQVEGLEGWFPENHLAFTIPRNQFAEAVAWLAQRVELIESDGESEFALGEPWLSESVYFRGPDGIVLEFIARHALANDAATPFGPQSIVSVSEVGIAVPQARDAVDALASKLGLAKFAGASDSFAAVGDEDALLIVVDAGRVWFPTGESLASGGPLHIELAGAPHAGRFDSGLGAVVESRA